MELFHPRLNPKWLKTIMEVPLEFPQHTFIFLTKRPWELPKWNPWPYNCSVGATATNRAQYITATSWRGLDAINASVKFISFEPLMEQIGASLYRLKGVQWVIIGAETGNRKGKVLPQIEWVQEIEAAADEAGIPVFEKDNLTGIIIDRPLRQEWPR